MPLTPRNIVAYDCETPLIAPGLLAPPLVCVTFAHRDTSYWRILHRSDRHTIVENVQRAHDTADAIVGANTAFDACVVMDYDERLVLPVLLAYEEGRVFDVLINAKLADIARGQLGGSTDGHGVYSRRGYSLADLVKRDTGKDRSAEKSDPGGWRMRYAELHDVPINQWPEDAITYAIEDADDTLEVFERQLLDHVWQPDAAARARCYLALHMLSVHGIMTDPEAIDALEGATAQRFKDLTHELHAAGLVRSNGTRDTKKAKKRLVEIYRANGVPVPLTDTGWKLIKAEVKKLRDEGASREIIDDVKRQCVEILADEYPSLDEESCNGTGDDLLEKYAERTKLATVVDTHIPDLRKGVTTPIQARWDMAESGRVTCSKGRGGSVNGFQLTNPIRSMVLTCPACEGYPGEGIECAHCGGKGSFVGPGVRECFRARPGYVFIDADFTGLELCTVAQACIDIVGWSDLGDAINAGLDPHLDFGAQLLGITYDEAVRRKHEKEVKEARQLAKVANFGFPGGLGAEGFLAFARGYGIKTLTEDRAKELKAAWLARWTEFAPYFAHVRGLVEDTGGLAEVVQLYSHRVRGLVPYTAACNTYFQGLGADGATAALWAVTIRCYADPESPLFGCRVVNFIHDQLLVEAPIGRAHEAAVECGRVMVEACNAFLPNVPVKCAPCLSFAWHKDAEAVFDLPQVQRDPTTWMLKEPRLIPWDAARAARAECWYADGSPVVWA